MSRERLLTLTKLRSKLPRPLSGRTDRHKSGFLIKHKRKLTTLPVLRYSSGNLDGLYTQRFNRLHRRDGALFRGRYKAIVVDKDNYLAQVVRYIHLNPVAAGIVREPEKFMWSSHRFYLRPKEAPKWLRMTEVMA